VEVGCNEKIIAGNEFFFVGNEVHIAGNEMQHDIFWSKIDDWVGAFVNRKSLKVNIEYT
jgi:hypothetical protein